MAIVLWVIAIIQILVSSYLLLMGYIENFDGLIAWAQLTVGGFLFVSSMVCVGFASVLSKLNKLLSVARQSHKNAETLPYGQPSDPVPNGKKMPGLNLPKPREKTVAFPPRAGFPDHIGGNHPAGIKETSISDLDLKTSSLPIFTDPIDLDLSNVEKGTDVRSAASGKDNPFPWIKADVPASGAAKTGDLAPPEKLDVNPDESADIFGITGGFDLDQKTSSPFIPSESNIPLVPIESKKSDPGLSHTVLGRDNKTIVSEEQINPADMHLNDGNKKAADILKEQKEILHSDTPDSVSALDGNISALAVEKKSETDNVLSKELQTDRKSPEEIKERIVVGQHEAGGSRYIMYNDNSIDAETPHGRFHFSSIEEMKAYIAQTSKDQ